MIRFRKTHAESGCLANKILGGKKALSQCEGTAGNPHTVENGGSQRGDFSGKVDNGR